LVWFLVLSYAIFWPYAYLMLSYRCASLEEQTLRTFNLYMLAGMPANWAPGISALLVTRFVLHENWRTTTLDRLGLKRYYIWAWLVCPALGLITIWLSVLLGLAAFDPSMIMAQVAGYEFPPGADFRRSFLIRLLPVAVAMPVMMAPINMGEELGWRGFLLPRLMRIGLGQWEAMIITGFFWGMWHTPLFLSRRYPHLGLIMSVGYDVVLSVVFGWLRLASGSVWVAAVAHATLQTVVAKESFLLVPGFNGYLAGYQTSLLGWVPLAAFIAWLAWTGRLPVRSAEAPDLHGPASEPEDAK